LYISLAIAGLWCHHSFSCVTILDRVADRLQWRIHPLLQGQLPRSDAIKNVVNKFVVPALHGDMPMPGSLFLRFLPVLRLTFLTLLTPTGDPEFDSKVFRRDILIIQTGFTTYWDVLVRSGAVDMERLRESAAQVRAAAASVGLPLAAMHSCGNGHILAAVDAMTQRGLRSNTETFLFLSPQTAPEEVDVRSSDHSTYPIRLTSDSNDLICDNNSSGKPFDLTPSCPTWRTPRSTVLCLPFSPVRLSHPHLPRLSRAHSQTSACHADLLDVRRSPSAEEAEAATVCLVALWSLWLAISWDKSLQLGLLAPQAADIGNFQSELMRSAVSTVCSLPAYLFSFRLCEVLP
jgi:hypothetical protein